MPTPSSTQASCPPADILAAVGLRAEGIGHRFGALEVLADIDLAVPPGEVTVLLGPSGCGKSTMLAILGGLLAPSRGRVVMTGTPPPDSLNPLTYVFQDFALLPWRRVAGNVALVLEGRLPRAERAARVAEVLALTGLSDFASAWPRQLSGGMRQRLGIARALAVRPAVLLMDEPLSALDTPTRLLLHDEFAAMIAATAMTCVYVTHNLAEAVRMGHCVVVLSRRPGRVAHRLRLDTPLDQRRPDDPDLRAAEAALWDIIRTDAAAAAREIAND
ncbi:MAG: ATP-binding cassette domain-containing protein [Acetobacteraceae bacterium]|nr:ATP-binding cassette domain-containing protein [Acetobacteraceae bacterium]